MARDPVTQEWWALTAACQLPFDADSPEPNWQPLDEVSYLA
jgi:L-rhamnose mutarotase